MQHSELPKPLGPGREWMHDSHFNTTEGQWILLQNRHQIASLKRMMWGWVLFPCGNQGPPSPINMGKHSEPPFQLAEALYDAAQ